MVLLIGDDEGKEDALPAAWDVAAASSAQKFAAVIYGHSNFNYTGVPLLTVNLRLLQENRKLCSRAQQRAWASAMQPSKQANAQTSLSIGNHQCTCYLRQLYTAQNFFAFFWRLSTSISLGVCVCLCASSLSLIGQLVASIRVREIESVAVCLDSISIWETLLCRGDNGCSLGLHDNTGWTGQCICNQWYRRALAIRANRRQLALSSSNAHSLFLTSSSDPANYE